jgi:hypothetical protein
MPSGASKHHWHKGGRAVLAALALAGPVGPHSVKRSSGRISGGRNNNYMGCGTSPGCTYISAGT